MRQRLRLCIAKPCLTPSSYHEVWNGCSMPHATVINYDPHVHFPAASACDTVRPSRHPPLQMQSTWLTANADPPLFTASTIDVVSASASLLVRQISSESIQVKSGEQSAGIVYSNIFNPISLEALAFSSSVFPFRRSISSLIVTID